MRIADVNDFIVGTAVDRVNLIPSEVNLAGVEIELARMDDHLGGVRKVLKPVVDSKVFDYILVDCPPSLGILMSNALAAADAVLVPMQCEYYAMEGLSVILKLVERMRATGANPGLRVEGIAMTMYSHTRLADEVVAQVRDHYGDAVYKTVVPRSVRAGEAPSYGIPLVAYAPSTPVSVRAGEAPSYGIPLVAYAPSTPVAQAYFILANEFLARQKALAGTDGKVDSLPPKSGAIA